MEHPHNLFDRLDFVRRNAKPHLRKHPRTFLHRPGSGDWKMPNIKLTEHLHRFWREIYREHCKHLNTITKSKKEDKETSVNRA